MAQITSAKIKWVGKLAYQSDVRNHRVIMDAKKEGGGQDLGMSPKEMVLTGMCGCTGMDVISLLTSKYKLNVTGCDVSVDADVSEAGHPVVWTAARLKFDITGDIPTEKALQAVELSLTKYCGVSAMMVKAFPIHYSVNLNGNEIGTGEAKF